MVQLKENQKTLLREVSEGCDYLMPTSSSCSVEKSRNRIEIRQVDVFDIQRCLVESKEWKPYISRAIRVERRTDIYDGKTKDWKRSSEVAYYWLL